MSPLPFFHSCFVWFVGGGDASHSPNLKKMFCPQDSVFSVTLSFKVIIAARRTRRRLGNRNTLWASPVRAAADDDFV